MGVIGGSVLACLKVTVIMVMISCPYYGLSLSFCQPDSETICKVLLIYYNILCYTIIIG